MRPSFDTAESEPLMSTNHDPHSPPEPSGGAAASSSSSITDVIHTDYPLPISTSSSPKPTTTTTTPLEVSDSDDPAQTATSIFLRAQKKPKWLPYPVFRLWTKLSVWSHGPAHPRDYKITPFFPAIQEFPLRLVDQVLPRRKYQRIAYFALLFLWAMTFALVKRQEAITSDIPSWGASQTISCGTSYWARGNGCGINGVDCRPFNGSGFPFRCPANCANYHVLNPRAVGDQEVIYRSLVVGGLNDATNEIVYRGDSFICGAAVHAGVIEDNKGGCGVVKVVGSRSEYIASSHHGISSVGFDSDFPLSFKFLDIECSALDMRWNLLGVSLAYSIVLSLFVTSSAAFFFPIIIGLYWHIGFASDPPSHYSLADLVSKLAGKFLPAMFVAWVFHDRMGVKKTLSGLTAQVEKTVLWLGGAWVGALENYTLSWIPITRLSAHDLAQQPGARAALAIIIILLVVIVIGQIYCFRQEGKLLKYLRLYALFIGGIIILLVLPDLNLRIHHYILAILLIPGTSMQTRSSLLYQGFLVGLFANGIARWGFDPIIQTAVALQGDAQHGTALPSILPPIINNITSSANSTLSSITFKWNPSPSTLYDGISILINDVERFRTFFDGGFDSFTNFTWERSEDRNEYFRFAWTEGSNVGDYTKAGIWTEDGNWRDMEAGASKAKRDDGENWVQRK